MCWTQDGMNQWRHLHDVSPTFRIEMALDMMNRLHHLDNLILLSKWTHFSCSSSCHLHFSFPTVSSGCSLLLDDCKWTQYYAKVSCFKLVLMCEWLWLNSVTSPQASLDSWPKWLPLQHHPSNLFSSTIARNRSPVLGSCGYELYGSGGSQPVNLQIVHLGLFGWCWKSWLWSGQPLGV